MKYRVVLSWLLFAGLVLPLLMIGCSGSDDMCGSSSKCTLQGLCGWVEGKCAPRSDQDCEASEFCSRHGECKSDMGRCIAGTDVQCRNSVHCKKSGLCLARKGECVQITKRTQKLVCRKTCVPYLYIYIYAAGAADREFWYI